MFTWIMYKLFLISQMYLSNMKVHKTQIRLTFFTVIELNKQTSCSWVIIEIIGLTACKLVINFLHRWHCSVQQSSIWLINFVSLHLQKKTLHEIFALELWQSCDSWYVVIPGGVILELKQWFQFIVTILLQWMMPMIIIEGLVSEYFECMYYRMCLNQFDDGISCMFWQCTCTCLQSDLIHPASGWYSEDF